MKPARIPVTVPAKNAAKTARIMRHASAAHIPRFTVTAVEHNAPAPLTKAAVVRPDSVYQCLMNYDI